MTVVHHTQARGFMAVDVLLSRAELIEAVVQEALISQTEAFVDAVIDSQDHNPVSRESILATMKGVPASTEDYINDVLNDLRIAVLERLASTLYSPAVTGIKYDREGKVDDIEVDVQIN